MCTAEGVEAVGGGALNCKRDRSSRGRCCELQEGYKQQRKVFLTGIGVEAAGGGAVSCRRNRSSRGRCFELQEG